MINLRYLSYTHKNNFHIYPSCLVSPSPSPLLDWVLLYIKYGMVKLLVLFKNAIHLISVTIPPIKGIDIPPIDIDIDIDTIGKILGSLPYNWLYIAWVLWLLQSMRKKKINKTIVNIKGYSHKHRTVRGVHYNRNLLIDTNDRSAILLRVLFTGVPNTVYGNRVILGYNYFHENSWGDFWVKNSPNGETLKYRGIIEIARHYELVDSQWGIWTLIDLNHPIFNMPDLGVEILVCGAQPKYNHFLSSNGTPYTKIFIPIEFNGSVELDENSTILREISQNRIIGSLIERLG